jgi:hypothetical protein
MAARRSQTRAESGVGSFMRVSMRTMASAGVAATICLALAGCGGGAASNTSANAASATNAPAPATNAAASAPGPAADAASVQAFIAGLYAHYTTPSNTTWDYVDPGDATTYEPVLLKAMRDDSTAHPDYPGTSWGDVDILCMCQEYDKVAETTEVKDISGGHARAVTTVTVTDAGAPYKSTLNFDLVQVAGQWRVYDVGEPDHSFREMVTSDLAKGRH